MTDSIPNRHTAAGAIGVLGGLVLALSLAACGGGGGGTTETPLPFPPVISLTRVAGGLVQPVTITHAGDGSGRLFVVEQGGRIRIIRNGAVIPTPFLDITSPRHPDRRRTGALGAGLSARLQRPAAPFTSTTRTGPESAIPSSPVSA